MLGTMYYLIYNIVEKKTHESNDEPSLPAELFINYNEITSRIFARMHKSFRVTFAKKKPLV